MRAKGRDGIARAMYITATGRRVVILHAFVKKTQQTPTEAINLTLRRAKEHGLL
jgi:phage-related protein